MISSKVHSELDLLGEEEYLLDDIKKQCRTSITEIVPSHWIGIDSVDSWMEFILVKVSSEVDGVVKVNKVMEGSGSLGLREMRHTYWGNAGYLYYVNGDAIIKTLQFLKQYFDED
jgi:hypothetical protein